jgi:hypothetical protein
VRRGYEGDDCEGVSHGIVLNGSQYCREGFGGADCAYLTISRANSTISSAAGESNARHGGCMFIGAILVCCTGSVGDLGAQVGDLGAQVGIGGGEGRCRQRRGGRGRRAESSERRGAQGGGGDYGAAEATKAAATAAVEAAEAGVKDMAGALNVEVVGALKCEISAKEAALTKLKAELEQLKKQPAPPLLAPPPLAPPLFAPPPLAPPPLPGGLAPLAPPPPPPLPGSETAPTTAALIAPSTSMPPPTVPFHTPPVPVHSPVCLFTHQLCPPAALVRTSRA